MNPSRPRNGKRKAANAATTAQLAGIRRGSQVISSQGKLKLRHADVIAAEVQAKTVALKNELLNVPDETLVWAPQFKRIIRITEKMARWMVQVDSDIDKLKAKAGIE